MPVRTTFFSLGKSLCFLSVILTTGCAAQAKNTDPFSFNVVSDIPYTTEQEELLEQAIIPALHAKPGPFVLHLGDIKGGGSPCTNEVLSQRARQINTMHKTAVFYTPGDNDWTDCDRGKTGAPVSELEKLEQIRHLFYRGIASPANLHASRQPLFPENAQWHYQGVAFATLHVVGTNNGRSEILKDDPDFALSQVKARDVANKTWLRSLFDQARVKGANAIVIGMQADLANPHHTAACTPDNPSKCDAFSDLKDQLRQLSASFSKPVLLLHGDSSPYCTDKTFGGAEAPNLWRFNAAGDYKILDAVTISVDPSNKTEPFTMKTLRNKIAPDPSC